MSIKRITITLERPEGTVTVDVNPHEGFTIDGSARLYPLETRLLSDLLALCQQYRDHFRKPKPPEGDHTR